MIRTRIEFVVSTGDTYTVVGVEVWNAAAVLVGHLESTFLEADSFGVDSVVGQVGLEAEATGTLRDRGVTGMECWDNF